MACSFTLSHAGTPATLFPVARDAIEAQGGSLVGSPSAGSASIPSPAGNVRFSYAAAGSKLGVTVTSKPLLVSCAQIQSALADVLARVPEPEPITVHGEPVEINLPEQDVTFTSGETETVVVPPKTPTSNLWLLAGLAVAAGGLAAVRYTQPKRSKRRRRGRRTTDRALRV